MRAFESPVASAILSRLTVKCAFLKERFAKSNCLTNLFSLSFSGLIELLSDIGYNPYLVRLRGYEEFILTEENQASSAVNVTLHILNGAKLKRS